MGNDFERFVAMADYLRNDFEQTFLHVYPLERLISKCIYDVVNFENSPLKDLSDYDLCYKKYLELNDLARHFKLKFLYDLGQLYLSKSIQVNSDIVDKVFHDEKPDLVVLTYIPLVGCPDFIQQIKLACNQEKIPILFLFHGIGRYGIDYKVEDKNRAKLLEGDIVTSPSQCEFDDFYKLDICMDSNYSEKWIIGDPRLSIDFVNKVHNYFDGECGKKNKIRVAIFGTNIGYLEGAEGDRQILWLERIVARLQYLGEYEICIKFHPNNPPKSYEKFNDVTILESSVNSGEILSTVDLIVSPPTSIIFEAMILEIPVYVLDELIENPFRFSDYNVKCLNLLDLESAKFERYLPQYELDKLKEVIWGNSTFEDCRTDVRNKLLSYFS